LGSTSRGCNFIELQAQLTIEELITNSSLPTQHLKILNLSIKHKSLTLEEEKDKT
jgi:hypothetical protein